MPTEPSNSPPRQTRTTESSQPHLATSTSSTLAPVVSHQSPEGISPSVIHGHKEANIGRVTSPNRNGGVRGIRTGGLRNATIRTRSSRDQAENARRRRGLSAKSYCLIAAIVSVCALPHWEC